MAIAYVRSASNLTSGTTATCNFTSNSAGNLLIVCVSANSTISSSSVADASGNTYTAVGAAQSNGSTKSAQIFYAMNCAASAGTNTVTVTDTQNVAHIVDIAEYSGIATTLALGNSNSGSGATNTPTTSSFAVTNGSLVIGYTNTDGAYSSAGSGFTTRLVAPSNLTAFEEQIMATTSVTASFSFNLCNWAMWGVEFKAAGAATHGLKFNSSLSGLGSSGPFFHDRLA